MTPLDKIPTPETDAWFEKKLETCRLMHFDAYGECIDFARSLERRLHQCREIAEGLAKGVEDFYSDSVKYPQLRIHATQAEQILRILSTWNKLKKGEGKE